MSFVRRVSEHARLYLAQDSCVQSYRNTMAFLNFLLAEALAAGLERAEAQEREQQQLPPPPNFFVLPRDPRAWRKLHEACRKENMVIAIEITDNSKTHCKRVQPLFMNEARKFESVPFVRVEIEFGLTYKEVSTRYLRLVL